MFKDDIAEGCAYVFENFMVGSNDHAYRSTDHKYKLNFMATTKVFKVTDAEIPMSHFKFLPFLDVLAATREDKLLGTTYICLPCILLQAQFNLLYLCFYEYDILCRCNWARCGERCSERN